MQNRELLNSGGNSARKMNRPDVAVGDSSHVKGGRRTGVICSLSFSLNCLAFARCGGTPQTHAGIILHLVHIFEASSAATRGKNSFFTLLINES